MFTGNYIVATVARADLGTGTLSLVRKEAEKMATGAGATVTGAVSSKTDILVAGPGAGSKLAEAQKHGVKVWTEDEFIKVLRDLYFLRENPVKLAS